MQFQQGAEHLQRPAVPPDSPWRNNQVPFTGAPPQGLNSSGSIPPGLNNTPGGIKLPNLPRLGSQSQISEQSKHRPAGPQNSQPTFAQIVQQGQGHHGSSTPTGKVLRSSSKPSNAASSTNSPNNSHASSGAQILGSVNSQMMPRVNTSHGMSSLNTVLPGMSNTANTKHKPMSGASGASRTPMLQNLSIDDKSTSNTAATKHVDTEKYGLKPLLGVMESKNKVRQNAILGDDLSQSGLHMDNNVGRLSQTFASPWRETSKYPVIPDFKLPACYSIDTVVPQQQKLQNFDEGALFYIFYTMPRDAMQEAAAVELTNRSWRYHKELKMWLTKDPMSEPIQTNSQEESGIYIFFDPTTWKKVKKEYILFYPDIA